MYTRETKDSISDNSHTQRVQETQGKKANESILELGTQMDIMDALI